MFFVWQNVCFLYVFFLLNRDTFKNKVFNLKKLIIKNVEHFVVFLCNICVTFCVTLCGIFLKKMGTLRNESITRLCLVYHRRWYQKLLMLFFSNLQNCNLENFFATSSFRSSRSFYFFWLNSRWNFIKKNINFFKKNCQKNKIKKWNSMWRLKKFSEGARRNFEKFFNTTLNCCIKKH